MDLVLHLKRQEDYYNFQASLVYIVSARPSWSTKGVPGPQSSEVFTTVKRMLLREVFKSASQCI